MNFEQKKRYLSDLLEANNEFYVVDIPKREKVEIYDRLLKNSRHIMSYKVIAFNTNKQDLQQLALNCIKIMMRKRKKQPLIEGC